MNQPQQVASAAADGGGDHPIFHRVFEPDNLKGCSCVRWLWWPRKAPTSGIQFIISGRILPPFAHFLCQARHMSAQEYYRDHSSRPLSPPTNATDTSGDHDHYNATDVNKQTGDAPERATSPNQLDTSPSPSHERIHSEYSDASGYGGRYDGEGINPYGKNYDMADEESKEALVPGPHGRSNGYQDLGACFTSFSHPAVY